MTKSRMSKLVLETLSKYGRIPITVADYMREVSSNKFYLIQDQFDVFNRLLDDTDHPPESVRIFGRMVGVWIKDLWEQLERPERLSLVLFGHALGTVMGHMILSTMKLEEFSRALEIHFIEPNPAFRAMQKASLRFFSLPVSWHEKLEDMPAGRPCIFIADKFFECLPIHQFERSSSGIWHEILVDLNDSADSDEDLRFVLSEERTSATEDFERRTAWASLEEMQLLWESWAREEAKLLRKRIEVCPEAWKLTERITRLIATNRGAALIVAYGEDKIIVDSLRARAISDKTSGYTMLAPLTDPGAAEMTVATDFAGIKMAIKDVEGVHVYGPVPRSEFLSRLAIASRMDPMVEARLASLERKEAINLGISDLLEDGHPFYDDEDGGPKCTCRIGAGYKVMCILESGLKICFGAPPGFHEAISTGLKFNGYEFLCRESPISETRRSS